MRFLAPIAAGLLLDAIDLMTFGPVGLWTGLAIGGSAGWVLSPYLGFSARHRWLCALCRLVKRPWRATRISRTLSVRLAANLNC